MAPALEGVDLQHACAEWDNLARLAQKDLRTDLEDVSERLGLPYFKDRLKGVSDIYKKVMKLRDEGNQNANHTDVTDAWGVRYITLLQDEIIDTFEELMHYLSRGRGSQRDLKLSSVTYYSNRTEKDILSIGFALRRYWEEIGQRKGFTEPKHQSFASRDTGYSALHLLLEYQKEFDFGTGLQRYTIPFELQVRDIFEEGWSEISHRFAYKPKHPSRTTSRSRFRGGALNTRQSELSALKAAADAVSQQASLLDRSYAYYIDALANGQAWASASDINKDLGAILKIFKDTGGNIQKTIRSAYDLMRAAEVSYVRDIDNELFREFYRNASASFREAISAVENLEVSFLAQSELHGMTVWYHLMIEFGNVLVRAVPSFANLEKDSGARNQLDTALQAYTKLLEQQSPHPDCSGNAVLWLRLGQAKKRRYIHNLEGLTDARATLEKSRSLALTDLHVRSHGASDWLHLQSAYEMLWCDYLIARLKCTAPNKRAPESEAFVLALEPVIISAKVLITDADRMLETTAGAHLHLCHKCHSVVLKMRTEYLEYVDKVNKGRSHDGVASYHASINKDDLRYIINVLLFRPYNRLIETTTETIASILGAALYLDNRMLAFQMAEKNYHKLTDTARARISTGLFPTSDDPSIGDILDPDQLQLYRQAAKVYGREIVDTDNEFKGD